MMLELALLYPAFLWWMEEAEELDATYTPSLPTGDGSTTFRIPKAWLFGEQRILHDLGWEIWS